jgi:hypothetical protein
MYEPNDHFFGVQQVTVSVVTTRDLHRLTVELKSASSIPPIDVEKTFTSSNEESVSSARKITELDTTEASSIFSEESEAKSIAQSNFICKRSGTKAAHELNVRGCQDHQKVLENNKDPRSQMDGEQFVVDSEEGDSLEIIVEKSIRYINEDLEPRQAVTCGPK